MWFRVLLACALLACALAASPARVAAAPDPRALEAEAARLLARFAPHLVQHLGEGRRPEADRPIPIDFDGDWDMTNNWDNLERFGAGAPAAVYGSAILTERRAYLTYTLFYPRDYAEPFCLPYLCHDNDLESVRVVVARSPGEPRLVSAQSKAHLRYRELPARELLLAADGRPIFSVQSGGHGIGLCRPGDARCLPGRRRLLLYPPGGAAPAGALAHERYELLRLRDTLWPRRGGDPDLWGKTLPYDGRRHGRLGLPLGAKTATGRYPGGVRPPWALKGPEGARGDWFLDPAGSALHGARDELAYVFHPYLADLRRECEGAACPPPGDLGERSGSRAPAVAAVLAAGLLSFGLFWLLGGGPEWRGPD